MRRVLAVLVIVLAMLQSGAAGENDMSISSGQMGVSYDSGSSSLSLSSGGHVFLGDVLPGFDIKSVEEAKGFDDVFGAGKAMVVHGNEGQKARLMVFEGIPFVFVQPLFVNGGAAERLVKAADVISGRVVTKTPFDRMRALGTAGLTAPDKHSGSYVFLALADSESRQGVVAGWLTHERGSGILFSGREGDSATLKSRLEYGRLPVPAGGDVAGEVLAVGFFNDARLGLEQWADLTARKNEIHLRPQLDGYCTWYSRPHGGASDEKHVIELAEFAVKELKPYGFDFVQIDDFWQFGKRRNGPSKVFDRVNPNGPYKGGMKPVADKIKDMGLIAGIWWMPFAGDYREEFFADKQDMFVHKQDGTPYFARWGGTSMDMSNPKTRDYVAGLARRMSKEWGYKYFKMDGLWTGTGTKLIYVNNAYRSDDLGEQVFYDKSMTPIETYRSGFRLVRKSAGDDVFFLGCCISQNMRSFGASIGMVDAMRIGPDNGSEFGAVKRGPWHGSNRYFLHGRIWYNDPDPLYVRASMPIEHSRLICSWVAVSGQMSVSSEWYAGMPQDRLDLLRRTLPSHGLLPRPVDLFESDIPQIWLLTDGASGVRRDIVGLFNWKEKEPVRIKYDTAKIGLPKADGYVAFDYWSDRLVPSFSESLDIVVPAGSCRVLSVKAVEAYPQVISTSRHITQGIVDIAEERWNTAEGVLTVKSHVVAGDRYEVRIVVPVSAQSWQISSAVCGGAEMKASQDGALARISFVPEKSGDVVIKAGFKHAAVEIRPPVAPTKLSAKTEINRVVLDWESVGDVSSVVSRDPAFSVGSAEVNGSGYADHDIKPDTEYIYTVRSKNYTGMLSESAVIKIRTAAVPEMPSIPPKPTVGIDSLKPVTAKTGWGKVGVNSSCAGQPLMLAGVKYAKGMGVHAPSLLVYAIPEGMKRFTAVVGIDDDMKDRKPPSVIFKVYGDVKEMGEPPVLLAESPKLCNKTLRMWAFDVELSERFKEVRLEVQDGGDGVECDHADWVDAGFIR